MDKFEVLRYLIRSIEKDLNVYHDPGYERAKQEDLDLIHSLIKLLKEKEVAE